MSKKLSILPLEDIVDSIDAIFSFIEAMEETTFLEDRKTKDAVARNFEIIGEATNRIPESLKMKYSHSEWHKAVGLRNRIILGYDGVNYSQVWNTIHQSLPIYKNQILSIISDPNFQQYYYL
ncbi:MAG: DUF86 domain-containing protein [Cytophagales bacterium]